MTITETTHHGADADVLVAVFAADVTERTGRQFEPADVIVVEDVAVSGYGVRHYLASWIDGKAITTVAATGRFVRNRRGGSTNRPGELNDEMTTVTVVGVAHVIEVTEQNGHYWMRYVGCEHSVRVPTDVALELRSVLTSRHGAAFS